MTNKILQKAGSNFFILTQIFSYSVEIKKEENFFLAKLLFFSLFLLFFINLSIESLSKTPKVVLVQFRKMLTTLIFHIFGIFI